ncbi:MAG: hypothetical protein HY907_10460 [Deltaproteobacteria bacterium]|nr:hypothetical protein [Deltaproteobacteria bacterium]
MVEVAGTQPILERPPAGPGPSTAARLARALVEPAAALQDRELRWRAKLLSTVLLVLLPFMTLGVIGGAAFSTSIATTLGIAAAGLAAAYALSRTRHHLPAALLAMAVEVPLPFVLYFQALDVLPAAAFEVLACVLLNILLGSLLFGVRGMLVLVAINIAGLLAVLSAFEPANSAHMIVLLLLNGAVCSMLLLSTRHRDTIEAIRMDHLTRTNRELEALRDRLEERVVERTRELAAANEALHLHQDRLLAAEKMASLGRLTAGIAHEMGTPLAAVRSSLAVLEGLIQEQERAIGDPEITPQDQTEIAREMKDSARMAGTAAERAAAFVRGIKLQTRGAGTGERVRFDAGDALRDAVLLLDHALRKGSCRAAVETDDGPHPLFGSPGRFAQVVTNLVTNAIDAGAARGGGPIAVRLRRTAGSLELSVIDEGAGIAAADLPRIFDPMFTTKPFGEGTGLGLTIVHDIVTGDFGGTIEVASEQDRGTTFRVLLPAPDGGAP